MGRVSRWWSRHFLGAEFTVAIAIAVTVALLAWLPQTSSAFEAQIDGNRTDIYRTTAAIAGTLLGFSMTISTLVLGHWDSPRLRLLRQNQQRSHELWTTIRQATWFLAFLAVASMAAMIFDKDGAPCKAAMVPFLLMLSLTTARLGRSIWIIQEISRIMAAGTQSDTGDAR